MSVLIGHASIAEDGSVYGNPGDQTGREVCTRSWYNGGWLFVAIHPDAAVRDKHAKAVEAACANNNVGYSWSGRNTLYQQAKAVGMDISKITVPCNCDCSSLQNCAAVASGAKGVSYGSNGWVTTNMKPALKTAGYAILEDKALLQSDAYCVRGAIYVSQGHTVCALGNGSQAARTLTLAGASATPVGADALGGPQKTPQAVEVPVSKPDKPKRETCDVPLPVLEKGCKGEDVRMLQLMLINKGFSCGFCGADGDFGGGTYTALTKFQRDRQLTADGVCGAKTWEAIITG